METDSKTERANFLALCGMGCAVAAGLLMLVVFDSSELASNFESGYMSEGFDASGPQAAVVLSVVAAIAAVVLSGVALNARRTWLTGGVAVGGLLAAPFYCVGALTALALAFG